MKKPSAVLVVFCGCVVTFLEVNMEVFGDAVAAGCTAHPGQVVCADLQVAAPGLPTTRGTSIEWVPPF